MAITVGMNMGILGIQNGLRDLNRNAAKIASADAFNADNPADLAPPLVDLQVARLQIEASTKVVKAIDEALGSLINVKA